MAAVERRTTRGAAGFEARGPRDALWTRVKRQRTAVIDGDY